ESGLRHTVLRPVFFSYNYGGAPLRDLTLQGTLAQPLRPDTRLQQLSEDDYGRMVVQVFKEPDRFLGAALDVASTEWTMREVAETFRRVLARPVTYRQVPWDEFEKQAGPELTTMYRWFESVGYEADLPALRHQFGELTDLETYLRSHGWGPGGN